MSVKCELHCTGYVLISIERKVLEVDWRFCFEFLGCAALLGVVVEMVTG